MHPIVWLILGIIIGLLAKPIWNAVISNEYAAADADKPAPPGPPIEDESVWHEVFGYKLVRIERLPLAWPSSTPVDHLGFQSIPVGDEPTKTKTIQVRGGEVTLVEP